MVYSFGTKDSSQILPVDLSQLGLHNYREVFSELFFDVFASTLKIAVFATLLCLLIGFPVSYFIAFKVSEKLTTDGILDTHLDTDEMESLDYGVAVGAGLRLPAGGLNWTFEARYEQGLADVSKLPFGPDLKNGSVQALVGLEFPLIGR